MLLNFKCLIFSSVFALLFLNCFSQAPVGDKERALSQINSILINDNASSKLPRDSVAIYAINFSLNVVRAKQGSKVVKISANDSLAYKLFTNYKKLASINYLPLMSGKSSATIMIPILIFNPVDARTGNNREGFISIRSAVNAVYSLSSPIPYNNLRDSGVSLDRRLYLNQGSNGTKFNQEIIRLDPIIIELTSIK